MNKTPELDYSEIADKLDDIDTSEIFKSLEEVIDAIPGALEKLKSIDGEVEKLEYYIELMAIAQKLDNFREGKEDPNQNEYSLTFVRFFVWWDDEQNLLTVGENLEEVK